MAALAQMIRRRRGGVAIHLVLIAGSVVMAFPFVYGLLAAFSTLHEYETAVLLPMPHRLSLDNLQAVFAGADFGTMYRNSAIRAAWYGFWPTLLALLSGYAFARLRFPGRKICFLLLLSGLMIPSQVSIVPTYIMAAHWPLLGGNDIWGHGGTGMVNSWWALLSLGLINGYEMFLVRQSIGAVPYEYEEAARIDGTGVLRLIFTIYAPMIKPVLATLTIINVINNWNDFWTPLIFTNGGDLNTVTLGATNFAGVLLQSGEPNYPLLFMGATVAMLPTILIFLFFQRYLVQGFAHAGLKG